ncbi:MAG: hypothetical protein EPO02_00660 [Nitrospirae bacterium]|nr:MAG: hypothetical protein EPO02_00660 [Nitrospirota bacterium]
MNSPAPKPILGVDIDNVLADSDVQLREMIREMYGIDLKAEQMTRYEYEAYGVTWEQLGEVFRVFNTDTCRTLELVPGAKAAMQLLAPRYEIALVTSRDPEAKAGTEYWLKANALPYDQLHFNDEKHALGIPYRAFIEDRHEHAHRIAGTGVAVYLLRRPWNARPLAHPNVRHVDNWDEILKHLL